MKHYAEKLAMSCYASIHVIGTKLTKIGRKLGTFATQIIFFQPWRAVISGEIGESHGRHCGFKKKDIVSHSKHFAPSVYRDHRVQRNILWGANT